MEQEQLDAIRHSAAHMLAAAVLELYPGTKLAIGPPVENGFYYDFLFPEGVTLSDKDLKKIEKKMKKIAGGRHDFVGREVTADEAKAEMADQPFKHELIDDFSADGATLTIYESGPFKDLCRGGHVDNTGDIPLPGLRLQKVAGAYWRGDETRDMLTRIYGVLFPTREELDAYLKQQEEAKKRDHRVLGKKLDLFTFIDEVGPGLPLFYPKGALMRKIIEDFIDKQQHARGYESIWVPHITKKDLYERSGHLDKYDAMFPPMSLDETDYYLKPMNCPHFMMLYNTQRHSYRDLPHRWTATTTCYRNEKSGEVAGLTRVRALTQDDCHVIARPDQLEEEFSVLTDLIDATYKAFAVTDFWVSVSTRDPEKADDYLGDSSVWDSAEATLEKVVSEKGWDYKVVPGEAAFYGPKLDFMAKDAIGREWQLSTLQLDFNLPERFEMEYTDENGDAQRPVVIHRAILGSVERWMGVMIEHFAGNFPVWLSPVQIAVLPVADAHNEFARELAAEFGDAGLRCDVDDSSESVGKKIRNATKSRVPYVLVVGDTEMNGESLAVRKRGSEDTVEMKRDEFVSHLTSLAHNHSTEL
jgi:threonyl-tRNA synthetase